MLYVISNNSGLLDPIVEKISNKYESSARVNFTVDNLEIYCTTQPFFSDRWLLTIKACDLLVTETLVRIMDSITVDILVLCEFYEEVSACVEAITTEKNNIKTSIVKKFAYNTTIDKILKKKLSDTEILNYFEKQLSFIIYNEYKLPEQYIVKFTISRIFRIFDINKIDESRMSQIILAYIYNIAEHAKGNEKKYKSILDVYGKELLTKEYQENLQLLLPKPKYINAYNFATYVFSRQVRRKSEIYNILFAYAKRPRVLYKTLLEFFSTFEKIHTEYIEGRFTLHSKLDWMEATGKKYKITSKHKLDLWLQIITTNSLERISVYKEGLMTTNATGNDSLLYAKIVKLVMQYIN